MPNSKSEFMLETLTFEMEPIENTPEHKLNNRVSKALKQCGIPRGCYFNIGGIVTVVARIDYKTYETGIYVWDGKEDRLLNTEEVRALEIALTPVEEKYRNLLKAKAEMQQALKDAGNDFAHKMGL